MQNTSTEDNTFVDRRQPRGSEPNGEPARERRQFSDSRNTSRPEVDELAKAVDQYKLQNRRRFITFEELYDVIASLGYHK
ncbi:hypothetical protein SH668x_000788 [Planctomicrobium sp. SH668]|uniref:hypothetical protein n=1 Tax=Planctomicrobium sp. SH668 TaxID=3448126 RepID=UPI003F5C46AA